MGQTGANHNGNGNDKRSALDWTTSELVTYISERRAARERFAPKNGLRQRMKNVCFVPQADMPKLKLG
jgi:hypothetical protein